MSHQETKGLGFDTVNMDPEMAIWSKNQGCPGTYPVPHRRGGLPDHGRLAGWLSWLIGPLSVP